MKPGVLVISYDGILEPLGQSQVLAYFEQLSKFRPIYLISFEKTSDLSGAAELQSLRIRVANAGVNWYPLRYHKAPSSFATAWDIIQGTMVGWWLTVRYGLVIVHARSYVPSLMALAIKQLTGSRYVFDMRGFWADERVDGGLWPNGSFVYRLAKLFERRFLLGSDHVVSLTSSAVSVMRGFPYLKDRMPNFTVIPTCVDLQRFKPAAGKSVYSPFVLGYVGTAGTWYMFEEVAVSFSILRRIKPDARFLIVNRGEHDYIQKSLLAAGVPQTVVEITSCSHTEIPAMMARMHAGIFFIKPVFSKHASAPTKLAEFLGCGIPCLSNAGVGDMAEVLEASRVGVAIKSFDEASLYLGVTQLVKLCADPMVLDRCVAVARTHFSLDEGVARYEGIYASLGCGS